MSAFASPTRESAPSAGTGASRRALAPSIGGRQTDLSRSFALGDSSGARPAIQRQSLASTGGSGATVAAAPSCGIPSHCPSSFCAPFAGGRTAAALARTAVAPILLGGIGAAVSPRVVPLWNQYLFGGSAPQNLSSTFGVDFTVSKTTAATTDFLVDELHRDIEAHPPSVAPGSAVVIDIAPRIPAAIAAIGTDGDPNQMNFNVIGEIPGNIAGGIGKNEASCPVGAMPSPFDDDRTAAGKAVVVGNADGSLGVTPLITFTVKDTIDLCPGDCGAPKEQLATVPMSQFEASGISGDVPFTVEFFAPPRGFIAHPPSPPKPAAPGPGPASGPVDGEVTASALHIRQSPDTSSPILAAYPQGAAISILCQTAGTPIDGNNLWDKTDRGWVSDRYVRHTSAGAPPAC
jgi:hypothetical protein